MFHEPVGQGAEGHGAGLLAVPLPSPMRPPAAMVRRWMAPLPSTLTPTTGQWRIHGALLGGLLCVGYPEAQFPAVSTMWAPCCGAQANEGPAGTLVSHLK